MYPGFVISLERVVAQRYFALGKTATSSPVANAVTPMDMSDRFVTLTDSADGFVQIWELAADAMPAHAVAHISLKDLGDERYTSGCYANALWLTH
jgi:hypothetical protein